MGGIKRTRKKALSKNYLSAEDLAFGLTNLSYNNVDYSMYTDVYEMIRNSFPGVSIISEDGVKMFQVGTKSSLMASNGALIVLDGRAIMSPNLEYLSPYDVEACRDFERAGNSTIWIKGGEWCNHH